MGTDGGAKREEEAGCAAGHVFPAPGRLRQEDLHKFKASLGDILRSHPPQKIQKQNTQYKTKKEGTGKGIPTLLKLLGSVSPYHQIAARNDMEVSKRVSVLRLWPNPFSGSEEGQGQNPECPKGRALGAGGGGQWRSRIATGSIFGQRRCTSTYTSPLPHAHHAWAPHTHTPPQ